MDKDPPTEMHFPGERWEEKLVKGEKMHGNRAGAPAKLSALTRLAHHDPSLEEAFSNRPRFGIADIKTLPM